MRLLFRGGTQISNSPCLFIDIDEFKVFNDSLGHAAGDALLVQIAQRLTRQSPRYATLFHVLASCDTAEPLVGESTLARPGGDEFTLLIEELQDPSDTIRVAERIQQRLALPFDSEWSTDRVDG